jgi:hypothetical protein
VEALAKVKSLDLSSPNGGECKHALEFEFCLLHRIEKSQTIIEIGKMRRKIQKK